jgi:hypothetical protein
MVQTVSDARFVVPLVVTPEIEITHLAFPIVIDHTPTMTIWHPIQTNAQKVFDWLNTLRVSRDLTELLSCMIVNPKITLDKFLLSHFFQTDRSSVVVGWIVVHAVTLLHANKMQGFIFLLTYSIIMIAKELTFR